MGAPCLEGKGEGWAETGRGCAAAGAAGAAAARAAAEARAARMPPPCRVGRRRTSPRGAAPHPVQAGKGRQGLVRTRHRWGWLQVSPRRRRCENTAEWAGGATPQTIRRLAGQARDRWGPRQAPTRRGAIRNAPLALGHAATERQGAGSFWAKGGTNRHEGEGSTCTLCAAVHHWAAPGGPVLVLHEGCGCRMALRAPTDGALALATAVCA